MNLTSYTDPRQFLHHAQAYLEQHEAATSLILGNALRLAQTDAPSSAYLAVVAAEAGIELVAMLMPPHRLVLWGEQPASAAALRLLTADLDTHGWNVSGVLGPPELAEPCLAELQQRTRRGWRLTMNERIYQLSAVIAPPRPAGHLRLAEAADLALVAEWIEAFTREALDTSDPAEAQSIAETKIANRSMYLWDDNQPVTMVGHGRATPRSSTISLVYTPPAFRRRGYAMACVAELSQQQLDDGKAFCVLFTDLANATSNSIYQQIGYRPVCDFNAYDFDPA
jgi:predicted GNAT family acetyltransferase